DEGVEMGRRHVDRNADRIDAPACEFRGEAGRRFRLRDGIAEDEMNARLAVGEGKHLAMLPGNGATDRPQEGRKEETMASYPLIDIYCHIYPEKFFEEMTKLSAQTQNLGKRLRTITKLFDLDERFREMDTFGDYRQVISLPNPPIEDIAKGETGLALARVANDTMAELCARHPDRFPTFAAALSLTDVEGSLAEAERAIDQLGARGIQIFTNVAGRPVDDPQYGRVWGAPAERDLPIWLHPVRTAAMPDYPSEAKSRFEMWWCFGWPYDTSVAMARLVFAGTFDRHPKLKIITHHCGGMIPFYDGRVGPGLASLCPRTSDEDYSGILPSLTRPP